MAFITKKHLSRRTFLKGTGVCMALPLLESMIPAATPFAQTAGAARTRFGAIYVPHGATMYKWTPDKDGTDFEFSEILQPLEPFKKYVSVISDMSHPSAYGSGSATANHNRSAASFLSGAHALEGPRAVLGVSVDQVIAKKLGQDTPLPSIEMAIEGSTLSCDGLSCAYRNTISWQNETTPLPMQNSPQVVFERLFGDGSTDAERKSRRSLSVSLLDSVVGEVDGVKKNLPAADKSRLDQYLNDVREIERRIQKAGEQLSDDIKLPAAPIGIPADFEDHIKLMFDLQVLAWQADVTQRVDHAYGQGTQWRRVLQERCARRIPHAVAPFESEGEHGSLRGIEPVPRHDPDLPARQAEEHARWRRKSSRSLDRAVRQRHGRRQPAQS